MDNKTPIIVALITIVGSITVALITNWHSIFPPVAAPMDHSAAPVATQPAATPLEPLPKPADNSPPTPAPVAGSVAKDPLGPANVGGRWDDADDDYRYAFVQSGAAFRYSASESGQDRGGGEGTVIGSVLIYKFQSSDGPRNCRAALAADGKTISGSCVRGDQTFPVRLRRPATLLPLDALVRAQRP